VKIRDATPDDAEAACVVLRACITELCAADHGNDPALLERWLANKQPEIVAGWIARADSSMLVAVEGDTILAVGSVTNAGEIALNYVSPHAFAASVEHCSRRSKRAPPSGATRHADCTAPKRRIGSIWRMAMSMLARRSGSLA
jgi:hypothetical protein